MNRYQKIMPNFGPHGINIVFLIFFLSLQQLYTHLSQICEISVIFGKLCIEILFWFLYNKIIPLGMELDFLT